MVIKRDMACSLVNSLAIVFMMQEVRINSRLNCLINANEIHPVVSSECNFELSKVLRHLHPDIYIQITNQITNN